MVSMRTGIFLIGHLVFVTPVFNLDNSRPPQTIAFRGKRHGILSEAGKLALMQCQRQFQWERWNCPVYDFNRWGTKAGQALTREVAYLDAIIAAGIAFSAAKNCYRSSQCERDRQKREVFDVRSSTYDEGDQLKFGMEAVNKFLSKKMAKSDLQHRANVHNINVGKEAVRMTAIKECKCHGMSGTCTLKSCWRRMVTFTKIADHVHHLYKRAVRLDFEGRRAIHPHGNSVAADIGLPADVLVYLHQSPDYCKANPSMGWMGTLGRTCWRSDSDHKTSRRDNCRKICRKCGYGVQKIRKTTKKLCNCKVNGCCDVACNNCTVVEYFCK